MDTVKSTVTNEQVGKMLHLSHSMVSRLRSNDRNPSFETMVEIERKFGWMMESQIRSRTAGRWGVEFEEVLVRKFDPDLVVHETASSE